MEKQRTRTTPYGWIGFFALLAVVAFIGLSRHRDDPPAGTAVVTGGSSVRDRAESAAMAAELGTTGAPVDLRGLVRRIVVQEDAATVTVDGPVYAGLSPDDRDRVFTAASTLWTRAYKAQHGRTLDRAISFDFVDGANELVRHTLIEPE